jgi:hypothetical protein
MGVRVRTKASGVLVTLLSLQFTQAFVVLSKHATLRIRFTLGPVFDVELLFTCVVGGYDAGAHHVLCMLSALLIPLLGQNTHVA